jgi:YVTN family beta-propeller protein
VKRIRVMVAAGCVTAGVAVVPTHPGLAAPPVQSQSVPATSTLAVISTISVGDAPYGVAVNDGDDSVYVVNSISDTVSVINGRTGTVDSTISVGDNPQDAAVNEGDDTVYVTNANSDTVSVINGRTGTVGSTISVGDYPRGVAVNQSDDTVYVANTADGSNTVSVINGRSGTGAGTITVGSRPFGVAVNQNDDTVYVTNRVNNTVSVINGRTRNVASTISVGTSPWGAAVDQGDDTVYIANEGVGNAVSVINGRSGTGAGTITVGSNPIGVAVDQGDDTVYVANISSGTVSVINGRTGTVNDTITVGSGPYDVAVDGSGTNMGLVYVTNHSDDNVSVIARASVSLGSMLAEAGSTVTVALDAPQVNYDVDDSTVTSVSFGGTLATGLTPQAGDAWTLTVPAGSGTVPVTVIFKGGLTASAGSFTYGSPPAPPPTPPTPASAPVDVTATAGDASAVVTWTAPVSSGSFPVAYYRAVSSPTGGTCLVTAPALTCQMTGLTNGTTYTVTVQALTGAGWGATSSPSNAVTPQRPPQPSITITGTRTEVRGKPGIAVTGTTTGFGMGAILRPWTRFPGQTSYTQGTASILVDAQGGFSWERRTGKTIYISIRSEDASVESNRLILRTN